MYTINSGGLINDGNGTTLPSINNNTDAWIIFQKWLDEGNTPTPYVAPDPQTLKPLDLKKAENNYCIYMNTMAQTYNLTLTPNMTRKELLDAAASAGLTGMPLIEARQTIMELLNDVNVNGGRFGDITFHPEIL